MEEGRFLSHAQQSGCALRDPTGLPRELQKLGELCHWISQLLLWLRLRPEPGIYQEARSPLHEGPEVLAPSPGEKPTQACTHSPPGLAPSCFCSVILITSEREQLSTSQEPSLLLDHSLKLQIKGFCVPLKGVQP